MEPTNQGEAVPFRTSTPRNRERFREVLTVAECLNKCAKNSGHYRALGLFFL
jgi:hypothetical protein